MDSARDGGLGSQTGRFTYDVVADRWDWDDDVYLIHGYEPGAVRPTSELFSRHKHPDDRVRVEDTFKGAMETGAPFSISYRILVDGDVERRVVVVGEGIATGGRVIQLVGYYLDLTRDFITETTMAADAAVAASAASRDTIEQAKGVLMLGYGLDADAAFAMLKWWSRNRNVKVRDLAERLLIVAQEGHATHPGLRRMLDGLLDDLASGTVAVADGPHA